MTREIRLQAVRIGGAILLSACFILSAALVHAQESTVTFPVAELGNCASKSECHTYCDDLAHVKACVAFAESHGLMTAAEVKSAREFERLGGKGPGGCTSKDSCEKYCEAPAHMRQCLEFAKQSGMMDDDELKEAEKVATYVESGGKMPGGCRGEKECRAYCEDAAHSEECIAFAIKAGFMSEKEVELFKKTGGKGPGGCQGRACESYCKDESHRESCVAFAMEHDLMSPEDKQRMEEGREKAKQALEKAPPKVLECIESHIGSEKVKALRDGNGFVDQRLGEILPQCFKDVMGNPGERGPFGPGSAARECMRKVFGEDFEEKMKNGEIDPGARDKEIRECMQAQMGEGFLNDNGQWERPQKGEPSRESEGKNSPPKDMPFGPREGEDHDRLESEMRSKYGEEFDSRRKEMEERMRAEIESQMRSGNFDRSKLPPDFRPEGMFPPPESMRRPPEGGQMPPLGSLPSSEGMYRPSGDMMPPQGGTMPPPAPYQEGSVPPEGVTPPPSEAVPPPVESAPPATEPISMHNKFVANALIMFQSLLGMR